VDQPITQYHPDADGQLRNVDELRDLVHELTVNFWPILHHPVVMMLMGDEMSESAELAVRIAHHMVCPAEAVAAADDPIGTVIEEYKPLSDNGEGPLGPLDIPGLNLFFKP
jgi:hypothetical protein